MNADLERAAAALRRGRLDEAQLHAWNALLTAGPDDIAEFRRIVAALASARLQHELDVRWPAGAGSPPAPPPRKSGWRRAHLRFSLALVILFAAFKVWDLPTESGPLPATAEAVAETLEPASKPVPITGDGIWLVPLGRVETIDLGRLAHDLTSTYSAWAGPVGVVALPRWTLYPTQEQLSAEDLINLLNERYRAGGRTTVVGITDYDMRDRSGPYSYALRAEVHYGVVSTSRLGASIGARLQGHTRYERVRKLVKRQVEFHRNGGLQTDDSHSLLRRPFAGLGTLDRIDEGPEQ